jgi:hypothetical protein
MRNVAEHVARTGSWRWDLDPTGFSWSFLKERLLSRQRSLEEEHDFWGSSACLDLIAAALHRQGRVKAGGAAEGKP